MRNNTVLLGAVLLAVLSLILAMPVASITNHLLGPASYSLGRQLALNAGLGAVIMTLIGLPLLLAARRRTTRSAARAMAVPVLATVVALKEEAVASKRTGLRLTLDMVLPGGARQQVVSPAWLVRKPDLPRVQPGQQLEVLVDPSRPEHVFPNSDWLAEA